MYDYTYDQWPFYKASPEKYPTIQQQVSAPQTLVVGVITNVDCVNVLFAWHHQSDFLQFFLH